MIRFSRKFPFWDSSDKKDPKKKRYSITKLYLRAQKHHKEYLNKGPGEAT